MMIHSLALSIDGIIHTMVAIIQPETMPLANIWPVSFSMTLRPISRKAWSVLVSKIGKCSITYATNRVPQRLPTSTTVHSRNRRPGIGQGRLAHHWQHRGEGVFGEQLLPRKDHREEPRAVAEAGNHLEGLTLGKT